MSHEDINIVIFRKSFRRSQRQERKKNEKNIFAENVKHEKEEDFWERKIEHWFVIVKGMFLKSHNRCEMLWFMICNINEHDQFVRIFFMCVFSSTDNWTWESCQRTPKRDDMEHNYGSIQASWFRAMSIKGSEYTWEFDIKIFWGTTFLLGNCKSFDNETLEPPLMSPENHMKISYIPWPWICFMVS